MISFSQVSKRFKGGQQALNNVSFTIESGEMVCVTGHSGAGKSTLLKLIAAIELPSNGTVLVANQNIGKLRPAAIPYLRRNLGLVFQDHKLLYERSVFDNTALPLLIQGVPYDEIGKRVRAALDKVGLLAFEKALPVTLSGGEQQRLCIARAIVSRPSILLADEPTGNLDRANAEAVFELMLELNRTLGTSLIIVTHDHELAHRVGKVLTLTPQGLSVAANLEHET